MIVDCRLFIVQLQTQLQKVVLTPEGPLTNVRMIMWYFNDTRRRMCLFPVKKSARNREKGKRGKLEDRSDREREKIHIETDRLGCSLAPCCVESLVCVCTILTVWKMSLMSEWGEIIITETTFLTPQLWPLLRPLGGAGGLRRICLFPRETVYNTAGPKNTHSRTQRKYREIAMQAQIHIYSQYTIKTTHTPWEMLVENMVNVGLISVLLCLPLCARKIFFHYCVRYNNFIIT